MNEQQKAAEAAVFDQTNILPRKRMLIVYSALAVSLFTSFVDQNGIGVALPTIAKELNAESTISWAGTSSLIAMTIFQVLYGRLSDLFGKLHAISFQIRSNTIPRQESRLLVSTSVAVSQRIALWFCTECYDALRLSRSCWCCQWRCHVLIHDDSLGCYHLERTRQVSRHPWFLRWSR